MMNYVLMDQSHIPQIADLERACFSAPWDDASVASELDNDLALWLVAVDGNRVAGYVGSQSVMGEADMMNIAVDAQYRRQGIGETLINKLIIALKEREVYSLTLEVRASNTSAIALYEKLGFSEIGRRKNYYRNPREDALILRKEWEI